jgi:hypothetical protein
MKRCGFITLLTADVPLYFTASPFSSFQPTYRLFVVAWSWDRCAPGTWRHI